MQHKKDNTGHLIVKNSLTIVHMIKPAEHKVNSNPRINT